MSKLGKRIAVFVLVVVLLRSGIIGQIRFQFLPCESLDILIKRSGCLQSFQSGSRVGKMELSEDESLLAVDGSGSQVGIYEMGTNKASFQQTIFLDFDGEHPEELKATEFAFSPDNLLLAVIVNNVFVQIWDVESRSLVSQIDLEDPKTDTYFRDANRVNLTYLPSGELLAIHQSHQDKIDLYEPSTGEKVQTIKGRYIAMSPNESQLAIASAAGEVEIWQQNQSVFEQALILPVPPIYAEYTGINGNLDHGEYLHYSPDGDYLSVMGQLFSPLETTGDRGWMNRGVINVYETSDFGLVTSIDEPIPTTEEQVFNISERSYFLAAHHIFEFDGEFLHWVVDSRPRSTGVYTWDFSNGTTHVLPPVSAYIKIWDLEGTMIAEEEFVTSGYVVNEFVDVLISPKNRVLITMSDKAKIELWRLPN